MEVKIKCRTVGIWNENSYFLNYQGEAWLIDPGDEFKKLDSFFNPEHYHLKGIINTHGHFDHIGAVNEFKQKYSLPFFIHSKDKQLVRQGNLYKKLAGSNEPLQTPEIDNVLDNMQISIADKPVKIHYTPGHTHGSVCFQIDNYLFSGDILFKDALGRTDLPGGNKNLLRNSIDFILANFSGYTIFPGHGESFFLNEKAIAGFKKLLS